VGVLCDSVYTLKAWADSLGGVKYPLASDYWPHGAVSRLYGVFNEEIGRPERSIIVVDAGGIIRYIEVATIRRYTGGESPSLSRLGGTDWAKTRARVKKAVQEIAQELDKLD